MSKLWDRKHKTALPIKLEIHKNIIVLHIIHSICVIHVFNYQYVAQIQVSMSSGKTCHTK